MARRRRSLLFWVALALTVAAAFPAAVVAPDGSTVVLAQRRDARDRVALALAALPEGEVEIGGAVDERWLQLRLPIVDQEDHLALVAEAGDLVEVLQQANRVAGAETVVIDRAAQVVLGAPQVVAELPTDLLAQVAAVQFTTGAGRYRDGDGEEVIAAHHAVAGTPWVVLSRQPQAAADAARRRLRTAALTATAGSALIAAMLSFFGYRLLVLPIQRLVRAQAQVAGVADPGGGSEIAQLESTFGQLLQLEKDRESIGEVFLGRYRVIGKLGKGGSGTVYKGFDPVLQRSVALKAVPLGAAGGSEAEKLLSKLREEAVHLARLNHPNIVTVFDFERRGDTAYIAMEMVDGLSLAKHLARHGALAVRQATAIAVAITDALAAAHGVELIHGDLKPGNILLGRDGSVKVADFGTAQLVRDANAEATKLEGTAGYLAPEVLKRQGATRASDLFSLGVVIYEMLAGVRPFGKGSIGDVLKRTLRGDVEPLGAARPALPPELSRLVMTLLATDPTARLESADRVADELALVATRLGGELELGFETVIGPASSEDLLSEDFVTRYLPDH